MLKLSDLYAPAWTQVINNKIYTFKPLSLRTFAELEGIGISLFILQTQLKQKPELWTDLLYFLVGAITPKDKEEFQANLLQDPIAHEHIKNRFSQSLNTKAAPVERDRPSRFAPPPVIKNPILEAQKKAKEEQGEVTVEEMDMLFLFTLSRHSGVPLDNILDMTFKGVGALTEWLEENPPMPSLL